MENIALLQPYRSNHLFSTVDQHLFHNSTEKVPSHLQVFLFSFFFFCCLPAFFCSWCSFSVFSLSYLCRFYLCPSLLFVQKHALNFHFIILPPLFFYLIFYFHSNFISSQILFYNSNFYFLFQFNSFFLSSFHAILNFLFFFYSFCFFCILFPSPSTFPPFFSCYSHSFPVKPILTLPITILFTLPVLFFFFLTLFFSLFHHLFPPYSSLPFTFISYPFLFQSPLLFIIFNLQSSIFNLQSSILFFL